MLGLHGLPVRAKLHVDLVQITQAVFTLARTVELEYDHVSHAFAALRLHVVRGLRQRNTSDVQAKTLLPHA